jgi:hypothetical protein
MRDQELRTELAAVRKRLRRVDDEIEFLRNESRRFKRMGFGRDYHESQLQPLEEERELCLKRLALMQRAPERRPSGARPVHTVSHSSARPPAARRSSSAKKPSSALKLADVLVIPIALVMLGLQALQPKKKTPALGAYPRREPIKIRPMQAIDLSLQD